MNGPLDDIYRFQLTMTDDGKEALAKAVQEEFSAIFKKKTVVVDCPYAEAVEFGTTPSKANRTDSNIVTDEETGDKVTEAKLKFREWIGLKEGLHGKERAKKGDAIYHHVMEKGAAPHPYMRPAIEDMLRMDVDDIVVITGIEDVAEACTTYLAMKMMMYLERNESIATGALKKSIKIVPAILAENIQEVDVREDKYNWKPGQARQ